jgi:hypothetical protein
MERARPKLIDDNPALIESRRQLANALHNLAMILVATASVRSEKRSPERVPTRPECFDQQGCVEGRVSGYGERG